MTRTRNVISDAVNNWSKEAGVLEAAHRAAVALIQTFTTRILASILFVSTLGIELFQLLVIFKIQAFKRW